MADALDECEAAFQFIKETHNCPDLWGISSPAYKRHKKQANKNGTAATVHSKGWISVNIQFCPNLCIFPAFSVSSQAINIK